MEENLKIKEELFSIYKSIKHKIINDKIQEEDITNNRDLNTIKFFSILKYIKESIQLLVNKNMTLKNHYNQLEKYITKLEMDNKYYLKNLMRYKVQKDALEIKLKSYIDLEDEYEELKEKVKYEGGKFLENDRKDNEIIILRRENSLIKMEIANLENKNKKYEIKLYKYKDKINELNNEIEALNKRISISEKGLKENKIKNNSLYKNLTNSNSCCNLNYENSLVKMDNNNNNYKYSLKNMKNFYNINDKKKFNIYPPIFDTKINELSKNHNYKTINNLNANNFISSYSKIVKGFKNKNSKIPIKKEFTFFKELRNNSISVIHKEKDESKSILINGKNIDKIDKILT